MIIVIKQSAVTGHTNSMELPVTLSEIARHEQGELAQNVWPDLSPDHREFLISGVTPEEWITLFDSVEE